MTKTSLLRLVPSTLLLLGLLSLAPTASAEPGPSIEHQRLTSVPGQEPVEILVHIVSNSSGAVFQPVLYFRSEGVPSYSRIALKPVPDIPDLFNAIIPAALISGPFDYYLEASDTEGNGPSHLASQDAPFHVVLVGAAPPEPKASLEPAPPPKTAPASVAPQVLAPAPAATSSSTPVAAYALLGVGSVAAIAGVIVMIKGSGDLSTANGESANAAHLSATKMTQDHSSASTEFGVGGAILGAGVVAAGVGLYLYLRPSHPDAEQATRAREESEQHPKLASLLLDF